MQAIMEPIFEIPYLIGVVTLGVLILRAAKGRAQFTLFGIMAVILGCGDAFHLVPRVYALWTDGTANHPVSLGIGTLITSITMTIFYVIFYHVWQLRYGVKNTAVKTAVWVLAVVRIALCILPQNRWTDPDAPLSWGILRNIPFLVLGVIIIVLWFTGAKKNGDKAFRFMWLAVTLSFAFYLPVVLFADAVPALGALMIPKTCAYVWIVWMGYADVKKVTG
ncbi:MAG: hypothetical protein LBR72_01685 [Oscillospiraceae bacterium]|nr:hypothetical protein [Oscillospiraceae bacterium]